MRIVIFLPAMFGKWRIDYSYCLLTGHDNAENVINKLILILVGSLLPLSTVYSETRCSNDVFGNTICRNSDGTSMRRSVDVFGNETWRDDNGKTLRGSTDVFGNKKYRDEDGGTISESIDVFGNRIYRDEQGGTTRCSTDVFGDTVCY